MKKIIVLFLTSTLLSFSSCKKEGCTDLDATNFELDANSDDGSCTYQAQSFVGTYNVTGIKVDQTFGDTTLQNYQLIITHSGQTTISISNLGNTSNVIAATIKNNQLSIPTQVKNVVETWSGSGVLSGTTINLQYTESFHDLFFNEVAVKQ